MIGQKLKKKNSHNVLVLMLCSHQTRREHVTCYRSLAGCFFVSFTRFLFVRHEFRHKARIRLQKSSPPLFDATDVSVSSSLIGLRDHASCEFAARVEIFVRKKKFQQRDRDEHRASAANHELRTDKSAHFQSICNIICILFNHFI